MSKVVRNKLRKFSVVLSRRRGEIKTDLEATVSDIETQDIAKFCLQSNETCHVTDDIDDHKIIGHFDSPYVKAISPVIMNMKLFGMFYDRPVGSGLSHGMPSLAMIYCWLMTSLAWTGVFYTLYSIRHVSLNLFKTLNTFID